MPCAQGTAPALELAAAARLLRNFTFLPTAAAGCAPPSPDSRPHTQPPSVWERPRREDHPVTTSSSQVQYNFYSQRGQPNPTSQYQSVSRPFKDRLCALGELVLADSAASLWPCFPHCGAMLETNNNGWNAKPQIFKIDWLKLYFNHY